MSKNGLIPTLDGNTTREQDTPGKGGLPVILQNTSGKVGLPVILGRLFVVVLFITGIFMLYQMHITNRLLFNISAQFDKLDPQPLDTDTETNIQAIMNLDWICYNVCISILY